MLVDCVLKTWKFPKKGIELNCLTKTPTNQELSNEDIGQKHSVLEKNLGSDKNFGSKIFLEGFLLLLLFIL